MVLFGVFAYLTLQMVSAALYYFFGLLIASVLGAFSAAAVANSLCLRIYEHGTLPDIGLNWSRSSLRNLLLGVAGGGSAALLVIGAPLAMGWAEWVPAAEGSAGAGGFVFVTLVLLFGAIGEEMLFRGYGFQVLVPKLGAAATILPVSVLFAAAHSGNASVSWLALFNTFSWGVVLCLAVLRAGDLWLPIGMHFGWNWMLPLFGVNLSGFTMRLTGVTLRWRISDAWSGGEYGPEGGLLCTAVIGLLAVFLIKAPVQPQSLRLIPRDEETA